MKREQKAVAAWLRRIMDERRINAETWAGRTGGVSASTITRALKDDYQSVTAIPTLHRLAKAIDEPSLLDFLEGRAGAVPSEEQLTEMLREAQQEIPLGLPLAEWPRAVASGLHARLSQLANGPASGGDRDAPAPAGREAAARPRPPTS